MKHLAGFVERVLLAGEQFRVCFDLAQGFLCGFQRFADLLFFPAGCAEGLDRVDLMLDVGSKDRFDEFGGLGLGRFGLFAQSIFFCEFFEACVLGLVPRDADRIALGDEFRLGDRGGRGRGRRTAAAAACDEQAGEKRRRSPLRRSARAFDASNPPFSVDWSRRPYSRIGNPGEEWSAATAGGSLCFSRRGAVAFSPRRLYESSRLTISKLAQLEHEVSRADTCVRSAAARTLR